MEQKDLNMRIAMSLLRQCAWVWEHCTKILHEGEFKFSEVKQGFRRLANGEREYVFIDMYQCKYWDVFNKQPIDGLTFDRKEMRSTVKIENFSCSFFLRDVFSVTASFCKWNCPSMANKARFCYKGGERYARLPELPKPKVNKSKTTKPKAKATVKAIPSAKPLTFAEQLR